MRWAAFIMVCGLLLATSTAVLRQDLNAPIPQLHKKQRVRSYCRIQGFDNTLFYKIAPGISRLKLRMRKETGATEQVTFSINLLNENQEPIDSKNISVSIEGRADKRAEIQLDDQVLGVSTQRVRLLELAAGPMGATLQLNFPKRHRPLWIRALRLSKNTNKWRRMAASAPMGQRPVMDMILEKPNVDPERSKVQPVLPKTGSSTQTSDTILVRMFRLGDLGVEVPLYELTGGTLRLKVRGLGAADEPAQVGLGYQIFRGEEIVSQGKLHATRDSAAHDRLKIGTPPTEMLHPISQELTRYLHFPPKATRLILSRAPVSTQNSFVQVSAWTGPFSGAGLGRFAPRSTPPVWISIKPTNYPSLILAQQVAWLERSPSAHEPPIKSNQPKPNPADFRSLQPDSQARRILLEPRKTASQPGDLVRIGPQGVSMCAQPSVKTDLLIRLSDTHRLGQPLKIQLDGLDATSTKPLTSSLSIPIRPTTQDCQHLSVIGLQDHDIALIDARLAPKSRSWVRREVWEVNAHTTIQIPFRYTAPERITVSVYLRPNDRALVRLKIDGSRPRCQTGSLSIGYTRPVVEKAIPTGSKSNVLLLDRPHQALSQPHRVSLRLADDLSPGMHRLSIQVIGAKRAWVRASIRADQRFLKKGRQP